MISMKKTTFFLIVGYICALIFPTHIVFSENSKGDLIRAAEKRLENSPTIEKYKQLADLYDDHKVTSSRAHQTYIYLIEHDIEPDFNIMRLGKALEGHDITYIEEIISQAIEKNRQKIALYTMAADIYSLFGDYEKAHIILDTALERVSGDTQLYGKKASLYAKQKKFEEASTYYEKAITLNPNHPHHYYSYAIFLLYEKNEKKQASEWLQKGLSIDPNYALLYVGLGNVHFVSKEYPQAVEMYEKGLSIDNNNPKAQYGLGRAYMALKDYDKALASFSQASKNASPFYACPYQGFGNVYRKIGNSTKAEKNYLRVIKLEPNEPQGYYDLAWYYVEVGNYRKAAKYIEDVLELTQERNLLCNALALKAFIMVLTGEYEAAEHFLTGIENDYGKLISAAMVRGHIYNAQQEYKKAEKEFRFVVNSKDTSRFRTFAQIGLGWVYANQFQQERAINMYEKVIANDPLNFLALLGLGNAHNWLKKYEEAAEYFSRVLEASPRNEYALAELGTVYLNQGKLKEAKRYLEKSLAVNKETYSCPYEGLGLLYFQQGKTKDAEKLLKKAIDINPDVEYRKYNALAKIYIEQEKYEEAKELLLKSLENNAFENRAHELLDLLREKYAAEIELPLVLRISNDRETNLSEKDPLLHYLKDVKDDIENEHVAWQMAEYVRAEKRYDAGMALFAQLIRMYPHNGGILRAAAYVFDNAGEYRDAIEIYKELMHLSNDTKKKSMVAAIVGDMYYYKLEETEKAIAFYKKAIHWDNENKNAYIHLITLLGTQGNTRESMKVTHRALDIFPEDSAFLIAQATSLREQRQFSEAEKVLEKIASLDSNKRELYIEYAILYEKQNRFKEAIQWLEKGLAMHPEDIELHSLLAHLYEATQETDKATVILNKMYEQDPNNSVLLDKLGRVYMMRGEHEKAIEYFKRSKANASFFYACPYQGLGNVYRRIGKTDLAKNELEEVIKQEPFKSKGYLDLAYYYISVGELNEAHALIEKALVKLEEGVDIFSLKGLQALVFVLQGEYEKAADACTVLRQRHQDLLTHDPGNKSIEQLIGIVDLVLGHIANARKEYSKAERYFNHALEVGSHYEEFVYLGLGWVNANLRKHESAIEYYQKILESDPHATHALLGMGNAYNWLQDYESAEKYFRKILSFDSRNEYALAELGTVYLNRGDFKRAEELLQDALSINRDSYSCPYEGLGLLYMQKGNLKSAKELFTRAIEINPNVEYRKYNGLARIYIEQRKYKKARELLEKSLDNNPANEEALDLLRSIEGKKVS